MDEVFSNPLLELSRSCAAALTWGHEHYYSVWASGKIGQCLCARSRGDQRRPLVRTKWHLRGQRWGDLELGVLVDNRLTRVPAHQLEIHRIIVAEERSAHPPVADDASERIQHLVRGGGE